MLALLKLQNGTELIGEVVSDDSSSVTLENPLQINYRLIASQPMPVVSISRYMPFSNDKIFDFKRTNLLHVVEPREAMQRYYDVALSHYKDRIDNVVEKELLYAAGIDDDMNEDEISEAYEALLKHMPTSETIN